VRSGERDEREADDAAGSMDPSVVGVSVAGFPHPARRPIATRPIATTMYKIRRCHLGDGPGDGSGAFGDGSIPCIRHAFRDTSEAAL
jgi:hypothetical protein